MNGTPRHGISMCRNASGVVMRVLVRVCVAVISAALISGPDAVVAGDRSYSGSVPDRLLEDIILHSRTQRTETDARRETVTAASDIPAFRLGRSNREQAFGVDRYGRPYVNRGKRLGVKKQRLPDFCLRRVSSSRGDRLAYSAPCLSKRYKHASKLPRTCRQTVRSRYERNVVYGARCLANDGWRVSRRY